MEKLRAENLIGNSEQLRSRILKSKGVKFYIDSPISFRVIKISKIEASESVFCNQHTKLKFENYKGGIKIKRITK